MPIIEVKNLTTQIFFNPALKSVSFTIERGELFGLLGTGGAGKTILMRVLLGLIPATPGTAIIFGGPPTPPHEWIADATLWNRLKRNAPRFPVWRRVGYLAEDRGLPERHTIATLFNACGRALGMPADEIRSRREEALELVKLDVSVNQELRRLSRRVNARLSLALSVWHDPEIVFLDEPNRGLDPSDHALTRGFIGTLKERGKTIIVSASFAQELTTCHRVAVIRSGEILTIGKPASILVEESEGAVAFVDPPVNPNEDVRKRAFISYRRAGGSDTALFIRDRLKQIGWEAFLDVVDLGGSYFDERILREIEEADAFVVILSPGALDRCGDREDWLRREIAHALSHKKKIIPITKEGFQFPAREVLPEEIQELLRFNAVPWVHAYFEQAVLRLAQYLG